MTDTQLPDHQPKTYSESAEHQIRVLTGPQLFLKATLLSAGMAAVMLVITFIGVLIFWSNQLTVFLDTANISFSELRQTVTVGLETQPKQTGDSTTVLLLGLDSLETRPGSPQLTDTMIVVSLNYKTAKVTTISLPRDIWSTAYQTKINALYHYGQERYPTNPSQFPTEVISEMTGLPIEYTVVITMKQVADIIDVLGVIDVDIPAAFTDTQFPRPDVDVSVVHDPDLLYQTVTFEAGQQSLDSTRALQYIRSRKSGDTEGDDLARGKRQQLIIESLVAQLQSKETLTNPQLLGTLYTYYQNTFSQFVPLNESIGLLTQVFPQRNVLELKTAALPIAPDDPNGVLINPPISKHSVWVYEVVDQDSFRNYVKSLVE